MNNYAAVLMKSYLKPVYNMIVADSQHYRLPISERKALTISEKGHDRHKLSVHVTTCISAIWEGTGATLLTGNFLLRLSFKGYKYSTLYRLFGLRQKRLASTAYTHRYICAVHLPFLVILSLSRVVRRVLRKLARLEAKEERRFADSHVPD